MKTVKNNKMPLPVWILTLSAFAIGTAEFVIAGILTQVSESLHITEGQAGNLITAYALAIVIGGPILTIWLSRYDKKKVLIGLMGLFIVGNLVSASTHDYTILLLSRVITGLTQGPFYGIGSVVAAKLVSDKMAGQAVGQMFAGLTLANVLGVPGGSWIGNHWGWNTTFFVVAILGVIATIAIFVLIPVLKESDASTHIKSQLAVFKNRNLLASLMITILAWAGFMAFYGYIAPVAENVAGFSRSDLTWILVVVGIGLVVGNVFGGKTADISVGKSLKFWTALMILSLFIVGWVASIPWAFVAASFFFGVVSFANVPSMQLRVMNYGAAAPELASTANISAFNIANALGGFLGAVVVDSHWGAAAIPFVATIIPIVGLIYIFRQEFKVNLPKKTSNK